MEDTEATVLSTPTPSAVIVEPTRDKKKKKKKYSRGLRDIQKFDIALAKANKRLNSAAAEGYSSYLKSSRKSARKRRDGAIQDAFKNWAKANGKTMRRASSAAEILADAMDTKSSRRNFRTMVRLSVPVFFR